MTRTPLRAVLRHQRPLSTIEVVALCIGVASITAVCMAYVFGGRRDPLVAELERKYGSQRASRSIEEWIIRDYFQDRRGGVFLDVGASHYKDSSNTYFLETSLGWSGIAVDAIAEFGADYKIHRPRTRFVGMFASDVPDRTVAVVADTEALSSSDPEFIKRYGAQGKPREVPTTTLNAVMEASGIERIDFLSMDIELAEPKALAGFDIARYRPALVCIEAHPEVRQQILDYFTAHAYTVVGKYLRSDSSNLYFRPLSTPGGSGASASEPRGTGSDSRTGAEQK